MSASLCVRRPHDPVVESREANARAARRPGGVEEAHVFGG